MRRQLFIGAMIIGAAIALSALLIWLRPEPERRAEQELAPLVQVAQVELLDGSLTIAGSGTVRAREEVNLAAEVPGKLVYVNPDLREGQMIPNGAILFRIDPADYRNAVRSAQADIAARQVDLLQAQEEMEIARTELAQFELRTMQGDAPLYASVDENDYAARILPPDELTRQASSSAGSSKAAGTTNRLATREPQLQSANANLSRARAQLADARTALQRTTVRAPFGGIVRSEQIAKGGYVSPGQTLGSIINSESFEAVIPLSEREASLIPSLFNGARIEASVYFEYGGATYRWQAFVDRVSSVLNPQTRTIDVILRIPNPLRGGTPAALPGGGQAQSAPGGRAPPLFVGSFVSAEIVGQDIGEYASIPPSALQSGNRIWLVEDGKLRIVDATIIQRSDDEVLIRSENLGARPVVVIGGLADAVNGQKVRTSSDAGGTAESAKNERENTGSQ